MKFSLDWLKDHLDTDANLDLIVSTLNRIGLEVESVYNPYDALKGIVVACVKSVDNHPDADRLHVCMVDYGSQDILQIVCGAPNVRAGMYVALALPGAVIPNGLFTIKKSKIRGVESMGMMCSARELMLGQDGNGILDISNQKEIFNDSLLGKSIVDVLDIDTIIDVAITPDRADCFGVRGIARDLVAAGIGKLKPIDESDVAVSSDFPLSISCDGDQSKIDRYVPIMALQIIKGVKNVQSPDWLKKRLKSAGLEPISALVDITNYFCLDRARPLHAYDFESIKGDSMSLRFAEKNESLTDLRGQDLRLSNNIAVLSDNVGALGVLGIIGGDRSKISDNTSVVMIESAFFNPPDIAYAGRELEVNSDARVRFERGVDEGYVLNGLKAAVAMIIDICGGNASEVYFKDARKSKEPACVKLRFSRLEQISGMKISNETVKEKLIALGLKALSDDNDGVTFSVPSWRRDIAIEEDLIEEVLRLVGYDNVPSASLPYSLSDDLSDIISRERKILSVKKALCSCGFDEVVTYAFLSDSINALFCENPKSTIELANPISTDLSVMRCSILPNLIQACSRNKNSGHNNIALFEIGSVYPSIENQVFMAGGCILDTSQTMHWSGNIDRDVFTVEKDAISVIESFGIPYEKLCISQGARDWYHPGRSGKISVGKEAIAWFGEIHPEILESMGINDCNVLGFEINLDVLFSSQLKTKKAFSGNCFQPVIRDFAFVLDRDVPAGNIITAIRDLYPQIIKDINIFDVYEGDKIAKGKRSLAVRIRMEPIDATFTDAQLKEMSSAIIDKIANKFGGSVRQ